MKTVSQRLRVITRGLRKVESMSQIRIVRHFVGRAGTTLWYPWERSSKHACPPMSSAWSSRWWWKGMDVAENLVMVSINAEWWDWQGKVPTGRVKGRISKWVSKSKGREQLSIEWELGIWDGGYIAGEIKYAAPERSDLSKASPLKGKFLSDPKFAFTLETYANDTPAPIYSIYSQRKSTSLRQLLQ